MPLYPGGMARKKKTVAKKAARKKASTKKKAVAKKATRKKASTKKKAVAKKATRKKAATKKKAVAKKATRKKAATKKTTRTKAATTKATRKKAATKKATRKKAATTKATRKKAATKKATRKKALVRKATQKKTAKKTRPDMNEPPILEAPTVGDPAPDFTLSADDGDEVSLESLRGKTVVLYFYPRDSTPGCTTEACNFRDMQAELEAKGAVVVGVSRDSVKSHANFKNKQSLNFPLLSDPSGEMIAAYGAWGPKVFMGRKANGIIRSTFIIDPDGNIAKHYPKVSVKTHADEVLADLESMA